MNLRWGAPPDSISDAALAAGEWRRLPFPPVWAIHLSALPVGAIAVFLVAAIWSKYGPRLSIEFAATSHVAAAMVATLAAGVFLQLVAHPRAGLSARSGVGFWPSRLLLYVYHLDPLPKPRFLAQFVLPAVALMLVPLLAGLLLRVESGWLLFVACFAALCFTQNLLLGLWLATKVPSGSAMAGRGLRPFWSPRASEA